MVYAFRSKACSSRQDRFNFNLFRAFFSAGVLVVCTDTLAQETDEPLEEVVITGARGQPRSVADSPVPIDVFDSDAITSVSFTDTNDVLMTLVPSYTVSRQPIADGAAFIRPASLRGLPTDKTLVLINSKRRHRAALVEIGGSGTQGPDIAVIPSSALKNVEVLRDGSAAQYGSDAIAGVINFILKDNAEGGSLSVDYGEHYEGDGEQLTLTGNIGMPLGSDGFMSVSGEVSTQDYTSRSEQYCEPWFCLDPSNPVYNPDAEYTVYTEDPDFLAAAENASLESDVVQPWGQPNAEAVRIFFNSAYPIDENRSIYAFGNYSDSEADGSFFYRYPGNGTVEDLRLEDGSIYSPLSIFPGGFTPRFFGEISDYSVVGGFKGETDNFFYDISGRFGQSEIDYTLKNTINPSLGPDTPTEFNPGSLSNTELQLQADFVMEYEVGTESPLVFGYGLSYLDESYDITQGELQSYTAGSFAVSDPWDFCNDDLTATDAGLAVIAVGSTLDCANEDDPVYTVVGVGSNGFPGFSPEFSDVYERDSYAAYLDLSTDVTSNLLLQVATRYEDYSDFGSELVGKLAAQFDFNHSYSIRSSIGTGFRAPTPGQQGTTNVSTRLPNGIPIATGLFPASSDVAQALGAEPLAPETSVNYTLGFIANYESASITVDFYRIDLSDRTYAISTLDVSTDPTAGDAYDNFLALDMANVVGAESIGGVFYFTNAFDTITQGVDIVASYDMNWGDYTTSFTASFNYNKTEFDSDPSEFLNEEDEFDFENNEPNTRGVFTVDQNLGAFDVMLRANYYGRYKNFNADQVQTFDPIVFIDLETRYQLNDTISLAIGGRNIFDEYPEQDEIDDFCCGRLYSSATAVSWQGGYYFGRITANF